MGVRLVVVDDNPHVSWEGRIYPANATFGRFLPALLDVAGPDGEPAVARIVHCVPVRPADRAPATLPADPRIEVAATAPFDGIEGYLRHAPRLTRKNAPILRRAIREADLVWIKVPASNALLAAALARAAGVPRFGYVAGSAAQVAAGQHRGPLRGSLARAVGVGYDVAGRLASLGGDRVVVGADLDGDGIVTSLVEPSEVRAGSADDPWPHEPGRLRLVWAGRVASGKGLETLLQAVALLAAGGPPDRGVAPETDAPAEWGADRDMSSAEPDAGTKTRGGTRTATPREVGLTILGDGPTRPHLERLSADLGIGALVHWYGYVADRAAYLDTLARADIFVFPSPAEGFPKVVLDAFAAGTPVVATPSGALAEIGPGRLEAIVPGDPTAIAGAIRSLAIDPARARSMRAAGLTFAEAHSRREEAARLVARWHGRFPGLPWRS